MPSLQKKKIKRTDEFANKLSGNGPLANPIPKEERENGQFIASLTNLRSITKEVNHENL